MKLSLQLNTEYTPLIRSLDIHLQKLKRSSFFQRSQVLIQPEDLHLRVNKISRVTTISSTKQIKNPKPLPQVIIKTRSITVAPRLKTIDREQKFKELMGTNHDKHFSDIRKLLKSRQRRVKFEG